MVGFVLASCALVVTATWLGAEWISTIILGVPAGLWLIGAALAGRSLMHASKQFVFRTVTLDKSVSNPGTSLQEQAQCGPDMIVTEQDAVASSPEDHQPGLFDAVEQQPDLVLSDSGVHEELGQGSLLQAVLNEQQAESAKAGTIHTQTESGNSDKASASPSRAAILHTVGRCLDLASSGTARIAAHQSDQLSNSHQIHQRLVTWQDHSPTIERAFRIGLDLPKVDADRITSCSPIASHVQWVTLRAGRNDDADCRAHDLDALLRMSDDHHLRICTREHAGFESAWYDWAINPPLFSLVSLFPGRIDPHHATLGRIDLADSAQRSSVMLLLEAAASLSRSRDRLWLADRLKGRLVWDQDSARARAILEHLVRSDALDIAIDDPEPAPLLRIKARLISAWLGSQLWPDEDLLGRGMELCAKILRDEPITQLRHAGILLALGEDEAGINAMTAQCRLLRDSGWSPGCDTLGLVQSEIELGLDSPMTLSRVACGVCLLAAQTPTDCLRFVRDDLADEMRFARWLTGRDAERALLFRLFDAFECDAMSATPRHTGISHAA